MNISVVIPLLNEEESLPELHDWISKIMQSNQFSYEIIFIDDGSTDTSWEVIEALSKKNTSVKGLRFQRNYGKSQALNAGFKIAKGDVVITMDADLQDSPDEIPELYQLINENNLDLISGWKKKRYDSKIRKNIPSKLFNAAARKTSGLHLHDFNCGLKAYKKEVVKNIPLEHLLVETDCPYMAPEPFRGKRNSSLYIPYIIQQIAELKGISPQEVEEVTRRNGYQLFSKIPSIYE